LDDRLSYRV